MSMQSDRILHNILAMGASATVLAGAVALGGCESKSSPERSAAPAVVTVSGPRADVERNTSAPAGAQKGQLPKDFALQDSSGVTHRLSDYTGQVVILDFWATWCGPCKMAMPHLNEVHNEYKDRGVNVIGMSFGERGADPQAYMDSQGFGYGLLLDTNDVGRGYGVNGIPDMIVIGVDGVVLERVIGYFPDLDARLKGVIDGHLAEHGL